VEEDVDVVKGPRAALNAKDKHLRDLVDQVGRMERYLGNMDPSTKEVLKKLRENMVQTYPKTKKTMEINVFESNKHMNHMSKYRAHLNTARKVVESLIPDIVDESKCQATYKNMLEIFGTSNIDDGGNEYILAEVNEFIINALDVARSIKSYATYVWNTIFRDKRFDDLTFFEKQILVRMYTLGSWGFYKKFRVVDYVLHILRAALVPSAARQGEYYKTFQEDASKKNTTKKCMVPVLKAFGNKDGRYWSTTMKYAALFDSDPSQAQWIWSPGFLVGFAVGCQKSRHKLDSQFGKPNSMKILAEHQGHLRKYFYLGTDVLEESWVDNFKSINKATREEIQRFRYFRTRGIQRDRVVEMYEELETFIKDKCKGLEEEEEER
jgi:hypothetical protein